MTFTQHSSQVIVAWVMWWTAGGAFEGPTEPHELFTTEEECSGALDRKQTTPGKWNRVGNMWHGVIWWWQCLPIHVGPRGS